MADKISMKLVGKKQAQAVMKDFAVKTEDKSQDQLIARGMRIKRDAKTIADSKDVFDTGILIGSISVNWSGSGMSHGQVSGPAKRNDGVGQPAKRRDGIAVAVGTSVKYAIYNEFGTRFMMARPYLFPAYFKNVGNVPKDMKEAVSKAVRELSRIRTMRK